MDYKGAQGSFRDGLFLDLDCGDGFIGIHTVDTPGFWTSATSRIELSSAEMAKAEGRAAN